MEEEEVVFHGCLRQFKTIPGGYCRVRVRRSNDTGAGKRQQYVATMKEISET